MPFVDLHLQSKDLNSLALAAKRLAEEAMERAEDEPTNDHPSTAAIRYAARLYETSDALGAAVERVGGPTCYGIVDHVDRDDILAAVEVLSEEADSDDDYHVCLRVLNHLAVGGYNR